MPKESMMTQVDKYVGLRDRFVLSQPSDLSGGMTELDPQLCNDILQEDIKRLKAMVEIAEDALKHIRYHKLAIRQDQGYSDHIMAHWREHAVNNPPISDALWDFMMQSILAAGFKSDGWEKLEWVKPGTPAWVTDLAKAAIGMCWSPQCFMRCKPNEARAVMTHHGIWSHGFDIYIIDDAYNAPFYSQLTGKLPRSLVSIVRASPRL